MELKGGLCDRSVLARTWLGMEKQCAGLGPVKQLSLQIMEFRKAASDPIR